MLYQQWVAAYAGQGHVPVMLREVLQAVHPQPQQRILDLTFGRGGYSRALLAQGAHVTACDCDADAQQVAAELVQQQPNFSFIPCNFATISDHVPAQHWHSVVVDLGLSTPQLTESGRGFSFLRDEPLDMRADIRTTLTAAQMLNTYTQQQLADIFYLYGDEPRARHYANIIVAARPWHSAQQLANAIEKAAGGRRGQRTHPATRVFQALRIAVNHEFDYLQQLLEQVHTLLLPHGVLAVVSFHSGEDRIVKRFLQPTLEGSRYTPAQHVAPALWQVSKAHKPADDEIADNPPSRSAVLRVAYKIGQ